MGKSGMGIMGMKEPESDRLSFLCLDDKSWITGSHFQKKIIGFVPDALLRKSGKRGLNIIRYRPPQSKVKFIAPSWLLNFQSDIFRPVQDIDNPQAV
ncbi:MAG: hypothetical protein AB1611_15240 [bacterium]